MTHKMRLPYDFGNSFRMRDRTGRTFPSSYLEDLLGPELKTKAQAMGSRLMVTAMKTEYQFLRLLVAKAWDKLEHSSQEAIARRMVQIEKLTGLPSRGKRLRLRLKKMQMAEERERLKRFRKDYPTDDWRYYERSLNRRERRLQDFAANV